MLLNLFRIAIRNVQRNLVYSFINILGLAVGIACSILIFLWVADELSFDSFHENQDQLSQVWINARYDGSIGSFNSVPYPVYKKLLEKDSRIKNTAVSNWGGQSLLTVGNVRLKKSSYYVTEEFLEMFRFPLLAGQPETVLDDPNSIVLTERAARELFGDSDPINQLIKVDNQNELKVTGILKNVPANSSFEFDCLLSHKQIEQQAWFKDEGASWDNYSFQIYAELQPGTERASVEASIKDLLTQNGQVDLPRELFLHPLADWRLLTTFENGKATGGMLDYVQGFSIIAIFIVVIACINYMNLSTARSERRAREVGVRKSVGSGRSELIAQFLGEATCISLFAFLLALMLVEVSLPFFNTLTQKNLFLEYGSIKFWAFSAAFIVVVGVISGSYPAFYLSSFNPARVLKGKITVGKHAATPRKVLVVVQFFFSTLLIVGTIVIQEQIQFVKKRNVGYTQENLITVPYTQEIGQHFKTIREELVRSGAVASVAKSNSPITEVYANNFLDWPGKPKDQKVIFATIATELEYTQTMGIRVLEGRDFIDDRDSTSILVNKAAADLMGLENTIGTKVSYWGDQDRATIVGVIDDVVMSTPFRKAGPMFITYLPEWASAVTIRLEATADVPGALKKVEAVLAKYNPAYPFEYTFVDEQFAKKYTTITLTETLSNLFAFLTIFITGLGLFGLASFTAEQRTKEIGIRKVMGAPVYVLVALISKEFSRLVVVAIALSSPVAWYALSSFLERYEYRINFPWWTLGMAGAIALLFALAIVSTQALRAAMANPSKSLRSE
jgi:putative ABC transport system permease protein